MPDTVSGSGNPVGWPPLVMSHGEYLDPPPRLPIDDGKREPHQGRPANVWLLDDPEPGRVGAHGIQGLLERRQIVAAEPGPTGLIVGDSLQMLRFRLWVEPDRHRRSNRAFRRTSSSEIPCTSPLSSSRARRACLRQARLARARLRTAHRDSIAASRRAPPFRRAAGSGPPPAGSWSPSCLLLRSAPTRFRSWRTS